MVDIKIEQTQNSRLNEIDFENLAFGKTFTDHMLLCHYENGAWQDMNIVPYSSFQLSPANSALHYGQSIFEGLKVHHGKDGVARVFRPDMNAKRFNLSAKRMCMPALPEEFFIQGIKELVKLDKNWIPTKDGSSLYIRPFMFATDDFLGIRPSESYTFAIIASPVGSYYSNPVKVKIEEEFTRAVAGGTGSAKTAGNYAASLYPAKLAKEQGYDQLLWTDGVSHEFIDESGTMNVMFREGNTMYTPAGDTILNSITRQSVVEIAKDLGYTIEQRKIKVEEVIASIESGKMSEVFGMGTAATIAPIDLIAFRDHNYDLSTSDRTASNKILEIINGVKYGTNSNYPSWVLEL